MGGTAWPGSSPSREPRDFIVRRGFPPRSSDTSQGAHRAPRTGRHGPGTRRAGRAERRKTAEKGLRTASDRQLPAGTLVRKVPTQRTGRQKQHYHSTFQQGGFGNRTVLRVSVPRLVRTENDDAGPRGRLRLRLSRFLQSRLTRSRGQGRDQSQDYLRGFKLSGLLRGPAHAQDLPNRTGGCRMSTAKR